MRRALVSGPGDKNQEAGQGVQNEARTSKEERAQVLGAVRHQEQDRSQDTGAAEVHPFPAHHGWRAP